MRYSNHYNENRIKKFENLAKTLFSKCINYYEENIDVLEDYSNNYFKQKFKRDCYDVCLNYFRAIISVIALCETNYNIRPDGNFGCITNSFTFYKYINNDDIADLGKMYNMLYKRYSTIIEKIPYDAYVDEELGASTPLEALNIANWYRKQYLSVLEQYNEAKRNN